MICLTTEEEENCDLVKPLLAHKGRCRMCKNNRNDGKYLEMSAVSFLFMNINTCWRTMIQRLVDGFCSSK